jgi:SNF2 family DNA or RNA helicase
MGLGKTLSILALICGFLDLVDGAAKQKGKQAFRQSSSTLIVAPKSGMNFLTPKAVQTAYFSQP